RRLAFRIGAGRFLIELVDLRDGGSLQLIGTRDHANQLPALEGRMGTTLDDLDQIAHLGFIVLIMGMADRASAHNLAVLGMLEPSIHDYPNRLIIAISGDRSTNLCTHGLSTCSVRLARQLRRGLPKT